MSVLGNNILAGASGQGGYFIDRSLRFRSSASAYLSRTPASAATSSQKMTVSAWVKRGSLTSSKPIFDAGADASADTFRFTATDTLQFWFNAATHYVTTTAVFRDPSAWYHVVASIDTTQATASNRIQLYVNGVLQTSVTASYPAQNYNFTKFNVSGQTQYIGYYNSSFYDGYITEFNVIDGQALDPTYFGEYNEDTGVWQPIKYTGTYGTNGFYLNFSDNSTTTTLGYDYSGNSSNWTANNISVTAGATYDSMTDVPTLTSEDAANYATLNPLASPGVGAFTQGNLTFTSSSASGWQSSISTIGATSGKWYFEATATAITGSNLVFVGAAKAQFTNYSNYLGSDANTWGVQYGNGSPASIYKYNNGSGSAITTGSIVAGDIIQCAIDLDNGYIWFGKNNTWAEGDPAAGTGASFTNLSGTMHFGVSSVSTGNKLDANFGQRPFAHTPPTGFKSLNTYNLPDSTIEEGGEYFNTVLWAGDGSQTRSITDTNFQPDMVWMKLRTGTTQVTQVYDSVRGVGGGKGLSTAETYAEGTMNGGYLDSDYGYISSLDASGFSVNDGAVATTGGWINYASRTYVAWNWKANGSGVTNNEGTIESTVSANPTAGFSIVTYTGDGNSTATIGHGLGVTPNMVLVKNRDTLANWRVWHSSLSGSTYYLGLNQAFGEATSSTVFNGQSSTTFTVGNDPSVNKSGDAIVAYCFADVEGYSKFGVYSGNSSPDGTFVYLGFRVRFLLVKGIGSGGSGWLLYDTERRNYNQNTLDLRADLSNAEPVSSGPFDFLSNGFKLRGTDTNSNSSSTTYGPYIYMAFAENPFKNSLAR